MKNQNSSTSWKNAVTGGGVFALVGTVTYLALSSGKEAARPPFGDESKGITGAPGTEWVPGGNQTSAGLGAKASSSLTVAVPSPRRTALLSPKGVVEGSPLIVSGTNPGVDKGRVLRLKPASFKSWGTVAPGERILLPTVSGEELYGTVNLVSSDLGWYRMGGTLDQEGGTFQLNASSGQVHGGIYLPALGVGYQIQMDGSDVVLVERPLGALVCSPGIKLDTSGSVKDGSGAVARATTTPVIPLLNTRPGAKGTIYLDFAGGVINSTAWGTSINADPSSLSGNSITEVVERVAECFSPFQISVTTNPAVYQQAPVGSRMRVVVTPTTTAAPNAGGVAKLNSWKWGGSDIVCWVFNQGVKTCADAASHEVGHTLGLLHHGRITGAEEYYRGHGGGLSVPTSWGPIMGASYSVNLTQWSKGQYYDANNSGQDDLLKIASGNNFSYVSSLGANGLVRALPLSGPLFQASGTLTSQSDSHIYQFSTVGGKLTATVRPTSSVGTGDFRLDLLDGNGAAVVVSDPVEALGASISQTLAAGVYRLRVVPTGTGEPPAGGYKIGYSAYGSLGGYDLTGTVAGANSFPAFLNSKLITGTEKLSMAVKFEVTDASKTTVTKLAEKLPTGLTFDPVGLVLSGTPPAGSSSGSWFLTLLAKSSVGETRTQFNVVISEQSLSLTAALGSAVSNITVQPASPWIGVNKALVSGTGVVAQSGPITDGGTSLLWCNYAAPGGTKGSWSVMTFYWQSDTEPGKDIVQCRVDGAVAKDMITGRPLVLSGKTDWVKQTVLLSGAGMRRIEFAYTKDANLKSDVDKVWVYGVSIGQPPVIATAPVRALRVAPGSSVGSDSFSLTAEATGATSVAWWKDGVALANGTTAAGSSVSGVSTGVLSVTGAKAADAGSYWMVAKNSFGTVATSRAEVVLWVPPVVTRQPVAPVGLKVGDPLVLIAQVSGAQPMYYQWKKNGVAGRWSSQPSLMLNKTTPESAGKYVLVAVNPSGTVSSQEVNVSFSQSAAKRLSAGK